MNELNSARELVRINLYTKLELLLGTNTDKVTHARSKPKYSRACVTPLITVNEQSE